MTQRQNVRCALLLAFAFHALMATAQQASAARQKKAAAKPAPAPAAMSAMDPGERAFQANCTRCHNAPEQLSRRISGTVIMHMRVRASLSAQDQRDILHFFAP